MAQTLIKNLYLVESQLDAKNIHVLEQGALLHSRYSNITFKILEVTDKRMKIQAVQGKSSAENYFDQKRLREIIHELFDQFFPGKKIDAHAIEYKEPAANIVTIPWINKMMLETGTKLKNISEDTGIAAQQISAILNERTELSQPMKALFWYYFYSKGAIKHEQTQSQSGKKLSAR